MNLVQAVALGRRPLVSFADIARTVKEASNVGFLAWLLIVITAPYRKPSTATRVTRGTGGRIRLIDGRGGIVGIREQAKYSSTPLTQFLEDRLPHRDAIVESWTDTLLTAPDDSPRLDIEHDSVGWVLELRLGLDLANAPARRQELSYLPIDRCTQLLTAAGFQHTPVGALPISGTSDPILLYWSRTQHPVCLDDAQRAALITCLDLASFRQPMHRWGQTKTVDERRAFFAAMVGEDDYGHDTHLLDAFAHYWTAYLTRGRPHLTALGDRVIIAPELGNGFGIADLVIGNTLVDVKLVAKPTTTAVHTWLRQLLGYVLLDHHNALRIDAIAVYSGHNAQLVTHSLPSLLAAASTGPTPDLTILRTDFHHTLRQPDDLETAGLVGVLNCVLRLAG